jgi:hypothetical protein
LLANSAESGALRSELDSYANDSQKLSDDEVRLFCDQIEVRAKTRKDVKTCDGTLGYVLEKTLVPREWVLKDHLAARIKQFSGMRVFIYGHTHQFEEEWRLKIEGPVGLTIRVVNTGAFHRVVDEETYLKIVQAKTMSPSEGLSALEPEDLPPCYTAVLVTYKSTIPEIATMRWYMAENGTGMFLNTNDARCYQVPTVGKK